LLFWKEILPALFRRRPRNNEDHVEIVLSLMRPAMDNRRRWLLDIAGGDAKWITLIWEVVVLDRVV
jgi:hypothetical protein